MKKIIKPAQIGYLHKPYRYRQENRLSIAALVFFQLDETADLLAEHEQWPNIIQQLPPMQVLDEGMHKHQAEILVAGNAYPAVDKPTHKMQVRVATGTVDKSLQIIGDRTWHYGLLPLQQISEAKPIDPKQGIPVCTTRAWGGEDHPENPLGQGYTESRWPAWFKKNAGTMPNISYVGERLTPSRRLRQPAQLGPVSIGSKSRQKLAGSYNKRWLQQDFPGLANNIDWSFFNMAPKDQRLSTLFEPGQAITIEGMHPQQKTLTSAIPNVNVRAFMATETESFRECPLQADTLWCFPNAKMGVLIYHGSLAIADLETQDVDAVMLAYEHPESPKPLSHYQQVMALRLDPKQAMRHAFNDSQLTPTRAADTDTNNKNQPQAATLNTKVKAQLQQLADKMDISLDDMLALQTQQAKDSPNIAVPTEQDYKEGTVDLNGLLDSMDSHVQQVSDDAQKKLTALEQKNADIKQQAEVILGVEEALEAFNPENQWLTIEQQLAPLKTQDADKYAEVIANIQKVIKQQFIMRGHITEAKGDPLSDAAKNAVSHALIQRLQKGLSLQGFNLAGVTLKGIDFSGQDMSYASFERAELIQCRFNQATLTNTAFVDATLTGCDFSNANAENVNFSSSLLQYCQFDSSHLKSSQWSSTRCEHVVIKNSQLSSSRFASALIQYCVFDTCEIHQSLWNEVNFLDSALIQSTGKQLIMTGCDFSVCDFSGNQWQETALLNCVAFYANFSDVDFTKVLMTGEHGKSLWRYSQWSKSTLNEVGFRRSDLTGVNFDQAYLQQCDLGDVTMMKANASSAVFKRCMMMGINFTEANLTGSNWYQSTARKAILTGSDLSQAQLWGADLFDAEADQITVKKTEPASAVAQLRGKRKAA